MVSQGCFFCALYMEWVLEVDILKFCPRGPHQGFGAFSRKSSTSTPKYPSAKWEMKSIQKWRIFLNQRNHDWMIYLEVSLQRIYQNKHRNKSLFLTTVQSKDLCSQFINFHVYNTPTSPLLISGGVSGTTSQKWCKY